MSLLKTLADAFHEGGWPMWPILLLMIISWGIAIERVIYLKKAGIDKEKLLSLLKSQIRPSSTVALICCTATAASCRGRHPAAGAGAADGSGAGFASWCPMPSIAKNLNPVKASP